ncbi:capsular polysaccharide export protein [Paraburkholderia caballeronis]|nr:capsular polysaccharide export protein [Paraburkholderia caballeronis]
MSRPRLYTLTYGLTLATHRSGTLRALLDDFHLQWRPNGASRSGDGVLAWGMRPSALRTRAYAKRRGHTTYHVEDGFLRSVGLGRDEPPLSVVLDDVGIYLDAGRPSRLECLIARPLDDAQTARALALVGAWRDARVSKYNHVRDLDIELPDRCVLVVDQTRGDASIAYGRADAGSFQRMLDAALAENPDSTILLKVHPDVVAGRKQGHFDLARIRALPRIRVLDQEAHPASLLERVEKVYTVTSQMGFEALLWGRPVRVFGMPFYAGWGLTHDDLPAPERRSAVPFAQLVHAALIDYPRYVDPETGRRCEVETLLAWLALQRRMMQRFAPEVACVGFGGWQRGWVRDFFRGSNVKFHSSGKGVARGQTVAVWGRKRGYEAALQCDPRPLVTLEDGFIRSVGLGADLTRPLSWVQDDLGIYYDARTPSRLERILAETAFPPELLARAAALRNAIREAGITKYNLDGDAWRRPPGRHVILVPGQVETDASIRHGAAGLRENIALLRAVREANPDSHIVYKPHPDVVAGLRDAGRSEDEAMRWCDEVVPRVSLRQMLDSVDAVHVLTSLAGFEALLRDVPVTTYGQPFYAGWGLTGDAMLTDAVRDRRTRRLTLDALVAGALILYPAYVSRTTGRFTTPERVLLELAAWRERPGVPAWRHWLARLFRES